MHMCAHSPLDQQLLTVLCHVLLQVLEDAAALQPTLGCLWDLGQRYGDSVDEHCPHPGKKPSSVAVACMHCMLLAVQQRVTGSISQQPIHSANSRRGGVLVWVDIHPSRA